MVPLLSVLETSRILSISPSKLYQLVAIQAIPHLRIGARILFRASDLETWLAAQIVPATIEHKRNPAVGGKLSIV